MPLDLYHLDLECLRRQRQRHDDLQRWVGWLADACGCSYPAPPRPGETLMDFCVRAGILPSDAVAFWDCRWRCASCGEVIEEGRHMVVDVPRLNTRYVTCVGCEESFARWAFRVLDWPDCTRWLPR